MKKLLTSLAFTLLFSLPALAAVNINTASQDELQTINGIGPSKAQAIIEYREKNGDFKSLDDLDNVAGFGKKTVDSVKQELSLGEMATGKSSSAKKNADKMDKKTAKKEAIIQKKIDKK